MQEIIANTKPLILIVDDDQFMRVIFKDTLEKGGFRTATACDGFEALARFIELQPDLVLLDLVMPKRDGFDTCLDIRALAQGKHTPVLMVTGLDDGALIHRAFEAGATDFLAKSGNPELLVYRIHCLLRNGRLLKNLQLSEDRLSRVQQIARLGDWEWSPENGKFWKSQEMFSILGTSQDSDPATLQDFLRMVYPRDRDMVRSSLEGALADPAGCDFECSIVRGDGSQRLVWVYGRLKEADFAGPAHLVGTLQDVTELRRAEDRSRMLKEAVDSLQIGITFSDASGKIAYLNPSEARMHGYEVEELIGREARSFASIQTRRQAPPGNLKDGGVWRRESVNLRRSGEEFPVLLTSIPVRDRERRFLGIVTTCEDISEQKEAAERINRLAYFDNLTGLPNRGMFLERLHQSLALAARDHEMVSLVFLDLDNFKDVNDTLGHAAGDKLLCDVALRLAGCIRDSDILARLGGDEFVVLLTSVANQDRVAAAVQRMQEIFATPFQVDGRTVYSSASMGIALYPEDSHDASSLFRSADTAMYHAKNEGRAQYRFFSAEMNQKIMRRVALENSLRRGLEKNEFFLHYQPQWDLKTNKMIGAEVLLRWQSEDFGLMPPSEFISLTEDSGLIFSIGEWVLKSACQQAKRWADEGHPEFKIAVNVSGKQLKQADFVAMLTGIIRETGVDPCRLELEFTESVIMENAEKTIETLSALKRMGILLSIDDFGTGYSSLNYLKHFPVDRIKIDRSFVADVNRSHDDTAIVEAIITMAQSLSLKVLAEGVENSDQLHHLTALGCDEVQGFYLARPMPAAALAGNLGGVHGRRLGKLAVTEWFDNRSVPSVWPAARPEQKKELEQNCALQESG
jgi:diguanylate cyclase (GGDEF)-like protein/PAS domain S-box-containing protein